MAVRNDVAGFVLVGGQSRRMGRDKALLKDASGAELARRIAGAMESLCCTVALLGDPLRYGHLGLPVVPDVIAGCGPMAGLHAALRSTACDWNLLVACDMPNVDGELLGRLLDATAAGPPCIAVEGEPLCAVYHRNTLPAVEAALADGRLRMRSLLVELAASGIRADTNMVRNVNTEEDWRLHLAEKERLS